MMTALAIVGAAALSLLLAVAFHEGIVRPFRRMRQDARRWRAMEVASIARMIGTSQETVEESYNKARELP